MTAVSRRVDSIATAPGADWLDGLIARASVAGEDIHAALQIARGYGSLLPLPGQGNTAARWAVLSALGRANLTPARVFEAHTDAIAILAEAGFIDDVATEATYGVFAAGGPDDQLHATEQRGQQYRLFGRKPWCSLGSLLDVGLITAHVPGGRQLFRVELRQPTVMAEPTTGWVARGLRTVTSTALHFDGTPAQPIGAVNWYLTRPGFSWGGIGVAACWYGGALGLQDRLGNGAANATAAPLEQLNALPIGQVDLALYAAKVVLAASAQSIDAGEATGPAGELLALRTRAVVVAAAERTIRATEHALGPAPLAFEEEHARRVADLGLYLRQHHGDRDLAALGRAVVSAGS